MKHYIVLAETTVKSDSAEWWEESTNKKEVARVYDTFGGAKYAMRNTIINMIATSKRFPFKRGHYQPTEQALYDCDGDYPEAQLIGEMTEKLITKMSGKMSRAESLMVPGSQEKR